MKRLMAITGWTKEDWKNFGSDFLIWVGTFVSVMLFLCFG